MNFDLDDPLAGILSDGSDDSFFDDDILGKKKPEKKKSTPIVEKKNELFDLDDRGKTKEKGEVITGKQVETSTIRAASSNVKSLITAEESITKSPALQIPVKFNDSSKAQQVDLKTQSVDKINVVRSPAKSKLTTSVDKFDFLGELDGDRNKDLPKPIEKGKSSQSLLDDILGESTTKPNFYNKKKPSTVSKKQDFDFDSILGKSDSKQSLILNKTVEQKSVTKPGTPKEQVVKKSSDDWLGIFHEKDEVEADGDADMPAWLIGGDAKKKKNIANTPKPETKTETDKEVLKSEVMDHKEEQTVGIDNTPTSYKLDADINKKIEINNEDVTMESAALYLQQQESQIMVALQLKAQDEKLSAMQARQKDSQRVHREAARAQREQLDSLLQRQAEHRRQMQAIIAAHQERITHKIKSLLGTNDDDEQEEINTNGDIETRSEQRSSPYTKEKKQLLQLIQSLQENHDKEIDLMETSYRRQLAFVEVSFRQAEERMKDDSEKLVKFYTEKISWVDEHHQMYKKLTEDNLKSLVERHKAESEMLRQQHLENIKVLQEHHTALMENVKNSVKQEQVLIKDSVGFSSELNELLIDVKDNKSKCIELVQKIESLTKFTEQNTDKSVQFRETQISEMIQQLKMDRENFEKEKLESKEMVQMFETRLKQMTTMIEEETVALKQKKMEFEFEKATFSKQTEFAKNVLKKQDEEIKMLKEDIQKQYQEKITKIQEEKSTALKDSAIVAKEKAAVQSLKMELEKTRAELQAQLEEVTSERSKVQVEKQELHIEEQRLLAKSRDLDLLTKTTMDKQVQAEKKYSEAEFAQHKYEERIRKIQEHVVSLNAREKQIAKEKVALSRERLSLHNEKKQMESRQQCSLCRNSQHSDYVYNLPERYLNNTVSRDYSAMPTNIDDEMARLMGRTFKLRHSPEMNANYHDRPPEANEFDSAQATQTDSGAFKEFLDPKFMMLRLDVQKVISNLEQSKKDSVPEDVNED